MKKLLVLSMLATSLTSFGQVMKMKITNVNYPEKKITVSCTTEDCEEVLIDLTDTYGYVRTEKLMEYAKNKAKLERFNDFREWPGSLFLDSYDNAKRDFKHGNTGKGLSNSLLTILALPLDIAFSPMTTVIYFADNPITNDSKMRKQRKKGAKKLMELINNNGTYEARLKDYPYSKREIRLRAILNNEI